VEVAQSSAWMCGPVLPLKGDQLIAQLLASSLHMGDPRESLNYRVPAQNKRTESSGILVRGKR